MLDEKYVISDMGGVILKYSNPDAVTRLYHDGIFYTFWLQNDKDFQLKTVKKFRKF